MNFNGRQQETKKSPAVTMKAIAGFILILGFTNVFSLTSHFSTTSLTIKYPLSQQFNSRSAIYFQTNHVRSLSHHSDTLHKSVQLATTTNSGMTEYEDLSEDEKRELGQSKTATPSSTSFKMNKEAFIFMTLLAIQFGIQPGLVRAYIPQTICKSSVVLVQEFLKFFFAAVSLFASGKETVSKAVKGAYKIDFGLDENVSHFFCILILELYVSCYG